MFEVGATGRAVLWQLETEDSWPTMLYTKHTWVKVHLHKHTPILYYALYYCILALLFFLTILVIN